MKRDETMKPKIAILLYDGVTALDFIAPLQAWAMFADIHLVSATGVPIVADCNVVMHANCSFETCPDDLDVLFVPGGMSTFELMMDETTTRFIREKGLGARYVTSVCNGSLILAAAGLLDGYRAATHWAAIHILEMFETVEVVPDRVVIDRNRMTGGGVTAGLDFGLVVLAELLGEQVAKNAQLMLEYHPAPPFDAGHPSIADPVTIAQVKGTLAGFDRIGVANAQTLRQRRMSRGQGDLAPVGESADVGAN